MTTLGLVAPLLGGLEGAQGGLLAVSLMSENEGCDANTTRHNPQEAAVARRDGDMRIKRQM